MFGLASLTDGTAWANVRMGSFLLGTCALATMVLSWTREESDEVIRAREVVEEADRKNRLTRWLALGASVAGLYAMIQTSSYIATRERKDGMMLTVEDLPPTEALYSD